MIKALRAVFLPLAAAALMLSACQQGPKEGPLAGAAIGGPFSLIDQNGKPVRDTDFAGQYRLIYFGYTFCPDACPTDLQALMQGFRQFEKTDPAKAAKLQPIFITVDPARDTPAALKSFVSAFHPRLIGLTGSEAEIKKVATEYGVYYSKQAPAGDDKNAYLVDHSRTATLYGPDGKPIALIPQDGTPDEIASELDEWIR
ncbi:MAG TPA: SCO family protein [Sphingomonadaceae bacterium]|nr:SCO family protein [Sphingomonadaceae bacterium]